MNFNEQYNRIIDIIIDVVPELGNERIDQQDSFHDLGINSIERTEIIMRLLDELELEIPNRVLIQTKNIQELVAVITDNKMN